MPADDGYLLVVLLAEIGAVRLHIGEELADNLTNAIEVTGTHSTLHNAVSWGITELARVRFGINLLDGRGKGDIRTASFKQPTVCLERTRIAFQILRVVELCWIKKDADHRDVILLDAPADKRGMPFVQGTHCGYKAYALALTAKLRQTLAELTDIIYNLHALDIKSCKGTK